MNYKNVIFLTDKNKFGIDIAQLPFQHRIDDRFREVKGDFLVSEGCKYLHCLEVQSFIRVKGVIEM